MNKHNMYNCWINEGLNLHVIVTDQSELRILWYVNDSITDQKSKTVRNDRMPPLSAVYYYYYY